MSKFVRSVNEIEGPVAEELVGEVWPSAEPGRDPVLYGQAVLEPCDPVEVRSLQTFKLTYTVGRYGLDDTGAIRVVFRALGDGQALQASDSTPANYVTAVEPMASVKLFPGKGTMVRTLIRLCKRDK